MVTNYELTNYVRTGGGFVLMTRPEQTQALRHIDVMRRQLARCATLRERSA